MNPLQLLRQSWSTCWQNKLLCILGIIIAGAGGSVGGVYVSMLFGGRNLWQMIAPFISPGAQDSAPIQSPISGPDLVEAAGDDLLILAVVLVGTLALMALIGLFIAVLTAVVARIAQGVIIAGAYQEEGLKAALQTGWERAWRLIVIVSIPPIPVTAGALVSVIAVGAVLAINGLAGDPAGMLAYLKNSAGLYWVLGAVNLPLLLLTLALSVVQIYADRVCVAENLRAVASFRRGWRLLRKNLPQTALLVVIQLAVGCLLTWLITLPGNLVVRLALQPVGWVINGVLIALFWVMWTLVYKKLAESDIQHT